MIDHYYPLHEKDTNPSCLSQLSQNIGNYVFPFNDVYLHKVPLTKQPYSPFEQQSLDSVIENTQPQGHDIADVMIQDKLLMLRSTMQLLRYLIDDRSRIRDDNMTNLNNRVLQCESYVVNLEDIWPAFGHPMVEAKKANLSHAVNGLESEKNQEMTRCWSDQAPLYQELLTTIGEYRAAMRRSQLLSGATQPHQMTLAKD
jgi:hypothetical protein